MNFTKSVIRIKNVSNYDEDIFVYHLILNDLSEISELIEKEMSDIWNPVINYSFAEVKREIYKLILSKNDKQKRGICAEFFMHIFLRYIGYTQECLFSNLEENSMKKGFDGVYEFSNDFWIAESKCGNKVKIKHKDKIREALDDIETKVSDTSRNNPWQNAVNHIVIRHNGNDYNNSLSKRIANLSKEYADNIPHTSSEFNLIPTSTLFINDYQSDDDIKKDIEAILVGRKIKKMAVLCINNNIYNEFIKYLEEK